MKNVILIDPDFRVLALLLAPDVNSTKLLAISVNEASSLICHVDRRRMLLGGYPAAQPGD